MSAKRIHMDEIFEPFFMHKWHFLRKIQVFFEKSAKKGFLFRQNYHISVFQCTFASSKVDNHACFSLVVSSLKSLHRHVPGSEVTTAAQQGYNQDAKKSINFKTSNKWLS